MDDYMKMPIMKKLYNYQTADFEDQLLEKNNKKVQKANDMEFDAFENLTDTLKEKLSDEEYSEVNKLIIDYELSKMKHDAVIQFYYYKLGFTDGKNLAKLFNE